MLRRAPVILFTALSLGLTACESNLFEGGFSRFDEPVREAVTVGQSVDSYYDAAAERVAAKSARTKPGAAKNVILFIGDGMGVSTVTAARIHAGQLAGVDGESYRLAMETLPYAALVKTYSHDAQVSDSAATATAMVAGVKSPARTVGVTQTARFGNCNSGAGAGTDTIFELAENAGLATGVVSTARLTHATPASTFAESVDRNWENDTTIPMGATCKDIAQQFIDWSAGDHFEIALGGGRAHFLASTDIDPETDQPGLRADGKNLAAAWELKSDDHVTVYNRAGFEAALTDPDAKILGLFEASHMQYELDRDE
ncbi:MAG: alkaline phosphatase, partial [Pseudomonadota bacterium]